MMTGHCPGDCARRSRTDSRWTFAEALAIPQNGTERSLRTLEAQPAAIRELGIRLLAEAWLEGQRQIEERRRGVKLRSTASRDEGDHHGG